jgi:hypothetical protein
MCTSCASGARRWKEYGPNPDLALDAAKAFAGKVLTFGLCGAGARVASLIFSSN